jgi:hypothetical protein
VTASNRSATQKAVDAFLIEHFPWVPRPTVTEWDNTAGGTAWYTGKDGATIAVPKYSDAWNDADPWHVIHECGHVVFYYANSEGAHVEELFSTAFGIDVLSLPLPEEIMAEHFARAYLDGYDGHNYPQLVGLVPFDAAKMRAFAEGLAANHSAILQAESHPDTSVSPEWLGPLPGSNFMPGREGNPVTFIVDHWMAGTLAGADGRFHDPAQSVSAHYGVTRDGRIVQWVAEADAAYHAGNWTVNLISIGIEHEASPVAPFTAEGYAASAKLHHYLADKYGIRLEVGHTVWPHNYFTATACPGTLDLGRIVREAGGDMTPEEVIAAIEAKYDLTNTIQAIKDQQKKEVVAIREAVQALIDGLA